jgi:hypothetical protein
MSSNTNSIKIVERSKIDTSNTQIDDHSCFWIDTGTLIVVGLKNDHVWIQTSGQYSENHFEYYYNSGSSFMGFLMYVT